MKKLTNILILCMFAILGIGFVQGHGIKDSVSWIKGEVSKNFKPKEGVLSSVNVLEKYGLTPDAYYRRGIKLHKPAMKIIPAVCIPKRIVTYNKPMKLRN